jgi:ribulose-5-phosphate 4-epimerase/fuculose-1-phosphate aldolase
MFIHSQIHRRLTHARCVLNALRFFDDVAYDDDYQGLALDATEGARISSKLGGKRILFLANHGVVVVGQSIAGAFDDLYYLERACELQVLAQSTHLPRKAVRADVCRRTADQFKSDDSYAHAHLAAIRRILDRECPEYAQ